MRFVRFAQSQLKTGWLRLTEILCNLLFNDNLVLLIGRSMRHGLAIIVERLMEIREDHRGMQGQK